MSTNSSSFGTVVRFHCNPGFYLVGSQSMTCNSSGEWSHEKPFCQGTPLDHEAPESKCELFNDKLASVCKPFRANQTVFVNAARNQTRITHFVSELVKRLSPLVTNSTSDPPQCVTLLIEIICIYLMPNCRTDSSIMPRACKESCERNFKHQHLCRHLFDVAVGSFLFVADSDGLQTDFNFQCAGLPSKDSGSCYDVLLSKYQISKT